MQGAQIGSPQAVESGEKALKATNYQGLQAALEWIVDNPPDENGPAKPSTTEGFRKAFSSLLGDLSADQELPLTALLKSEDEIQVHSARTGHANFTESADTVKPLTKEEKQTQVKRIREYLEKKKIQRQEEERARQVEDEKRRREQEEEMKRAAEQTRREKAEDKAYRERLRAEIARDREEKMAHAAVVNAAAPGTPLPPPLTSQLPAATPRANAPTSSSRPTECRLQIRTPSGNLIVATFKPSEPLSAVVLHVSQRWPGAPPDGLDTREITLQTTFPTRKFGEEDLQRSLEDLGLCPSFVLMAQHKPMH
ncbi:UBX domain-containing protein 1 [Sparganum proliferum]